MSARTKQSGEPAFPGVTPHAALQVMRATLHAVGVADAKSYGTHALRRGHAQDMLESGASLVEILLAGDWSSRAFKDYLHAGVLEAGAVLEAHCVASDEEAE